MKITKCVLFVEGKGYFRNYTDYFDSTNRKYSKKAVFVDAIQEAKVYSHPSRAKISMQNIQKILGVQLVNMKYKIVPVALIELK